MRRLHTWAGLAVSVQLAIYGIAGLAALAGAGLRGPIPAGRTWDQAFLASPHQTDAQIAEQVCRTLGLTLALPVNRMALQHDDAGRLKLDLWHVNGHHRVTVMEAEQRIHVEEFRAGLGRYLVVLHMTTAAFRSGDWRMTAWAWWNEFALWGLCWMLVSGAWLWRRGTSTEGMRRVHRWAGTLIAAPLAVYAGSAILLAHRTWWPASQGTRRGWIGMLVELHRSTSPAAAAVMLAGVSLGLLVLGASGIQLGLRQRRERRVNLAVLAVSAGMVLFLVISMRL